MTETRRAASPRRAAGRSVALALLLGCSTLTACGGFGGRTPPPRSLTIDLSVPRAEAVRRTLSAFREQGYRVPTTMTSGLTPETEPFRHGDDVEAVFRATISGTGRSSRVVLSGTFRRLRLGGVVRDREQELRNEEDALARALWTRLDQVRLTILQPAR